LYSASPSLDEDIPTLVEKKMELNRTPLRLVGLSLDEYIPILEEKKMELNRIPLRLVGLSLDEEYSHP